MYLLKNELSSYQMSRDGNTERQVTFDNFDNLRGFEIGYQKLNSQTKSVPKILQKPKKTKEYKHLDEKSSERVKNLI